MRRHGGSGWGQRETTLGERQSIVDKSNPHPSLSSQAEVLIQRMDKVSLVHVRVAVMIARAGHMNERLGHINDDTLTRTYPFPGLLSLVLGPPIAVPNNVVLICFLVPPGRLGPLPGQAGGVRGGARCQPGRIHGHGQAAPPGVKDVWEKQFHSKYDPILKASVAASSSLV